MRIFNNLKKFIISNFYDNTYALNFILLFCSFFSIEMIMRIINGYSVISFGVLRIIVLLIIICYLISFFLNYFNSTIRKVVSSICVFIGSTYACLQLGFLKFLGVYASLQSANQAGAVTDYIKDFLKSFNPIFLTTYIPFVLLVIFYICVKKRFYRQNRHRLLLSTLVIATLFGCIYYELIIDEDFQNKLQTVSNEELFITASNPSLSVSELGVFGFGITDLRNKLFPVEVKTQFQLTSTKVYADTDTVISGIDDSIWESLINEESDETYNYLNSYFYSRDKTTTNDFTGKFKGKNLIVIMMESANDIFIEYPEYFPNMAKIINGGWSWENYYSPRNSCATLNNEFSGITSLYSISNTCTAKTYIDNTYFESMFNVFNDSDYYTFSAHDYTEHYYPRRTIHANFGSQRYYGVEDLGIEYDEYQYKNWAYDDEFMASVLNILESVDYTDGNFMTWLTTVSSHQPYGMDSKQGNAYYSMTDGTGFDPQIRRYMSKLKILDNALGVLLAGLEKKGILEDTVLVMYGDHYPYGIDTNILNTVMSYDTNEDMNMEQVPFVIYNEGTTTESPYQYTNYSTYINILPTVANLFDVKYESRLYMGEDLFSEDYNSIAVFPDGSWKNEYAFYNGATGKITYYSSFEYTIDELQKINMNINLMMKASTMAVTSNYFNYLKNKIDEKVQELNELSVNACLLHDSVVYYNEPNDCDDEDDKKEVIE